jgi:hypothetical protein
MVAARQVRRSEPTVGGRSGAVLDHPLATMLCGDGLTL